MQDTKQRLYVAIDLKSFYASVECKERNLDPLTSNLVVADESRTSKTICLAVSPSLKSYGIKGRARLFEVIKKVEEVNFERRIKAPNHVFTDKSYDFIELNKHPEYELDYIVAKPRMALYEKYSTDIYNIYLKYFSEEDIYVYSIDEVFIDVTDYLSTYKMRTKELATKVIHDVYNTTGITAPCGMGTNLYLAKVAMDIVAKHSPANENGVRIAGLDEMTYRKLLWEHTPLTDFWRVGKGYAKKLNANGIHTMGDVARTSLTNEDLLYKLFGINAELLIDHAWGYEPCTMKSIKSYVPTTNSLSTGQVLSCPHNYEQTKTNVKEMAELLSLDLVSKRLVTNQIVLRIDYDTENISNPEISRLYNGDVELDRYGKTVSKHALGTGNIGHHTSSTKIIMQETINLFDRIIDKSLLARRITISANNVLSENSLKEKDKFEQIDLFTDYKQQEKEKQNEAKEKNLQIAMLEIKNRYGKNAILKGMNFEDGATTRDRNKQIGGHSS